MIPQYITCHFVWIKHPGGRKYRQFELLGCFTHFTGFTGSTRDTRRFCAAGSEHQRLRTEFCDSTCGMFQTTSSVITVWFVKMFQLHEPGVECVTCQNLALVQDDDPRVLVVLLLYLVFGVDARPLHLKPQTGSYHQVIDPKSIKYTEINYLSGQTLINHPTNQ